MNNSTQVIDEHRLYIAELRAQLAERDAKLQAIRDVVHRWIDNKQGSSPDGMLKVLEILYPPPPVTDVTP